MVNVALIVAFFCFYFISFYKPSRKDIQWYKAMAKHFKKGSGTNTMSNKGLPNIPSYFFTVIWFVLYMLIAISLYIYFNGNCFFDRHRIFNEDDEINNEDYEKGLIVLVLAMLDAFLNKMWPYIFFKAKKYGLALIMVLIMLVFHGVILWAMATTKQCRLDSFTNRYWVSFALYLVYTVWLCLVCIINLRWVRAFGWTLPKSCPKVIAAHCARWRKKKINKCNYKCQEPTCAAFLKRSNCPIYTETNSCSVDRTTNCSNGIDSTAYALNDSNYIY